MEIEFSMFVKGGIWYLLKEVWTIGYNGQLLHYTTMKPYF